MLLLALLGCATEEIGLSDSVPFDYGCGGPVYVAQAGFDDADPVLADWHAAAFGAAPDPYHVHVSWADEPSTTLSIVWRTDAETLATQVQYGTDTTFDTTVDGGSFLVGADPLNGRVHEARLCGLTPGTTYYYRVGGDGHWSEPRTFTTAPAPGTAAPFRFAVVGDTRGDQATFALLLDAIEDKGVDFYLFTGDAVSLGVDMEEWGAWFDAGEGHFDQRPVVMAHGNHEFQAQNYYALFAMPGNEQWFSLDYADAHLVVLNDTVATPGDKQVQAEWMAEGLAASTARWKFALHHMPAWSSCTNHGSNLENQALWSPIEEAGGVAVDFAGHNHNYERSQPLRGGIPTEGGTTYVVAAGGGAPLYSNDRPHTFTKVAAVTEHYVLVDVVDGTLTLTAHDLAGNVLDTFVTTR